MGLVMSLLASCYGNRSQYIYTVYTGSARYFYDFAIILILIFFFLSFFFFHRDRHLFGVKVQPLTERTRTKERCKTCGSLTVRRTGHVIILCCVRHLRFHRWKEPLKMLWHNKQKQTTNCV